MGRVEASPVGLLLSHHELLPLRTAPARATRCSAQPQPAPGLPAAADCPESFLEEGVVQHPLRFSFWLLRKRNEFVGVAIASPAEHL